MKTKPAVKYWMIAAAGTALVAVVCALVNLENPALSLMVHLAAFIFVCVAVLFVVLALTSAAQPIHLKNFDQSVGGKNPLPPPPEIPGQIQPKEACMGSLRGALHAIGRFSGAFEKPLWKWQLERCSRALKDVLDDCEAGADVSFAMDFATQYLPSAMQYLAACAAEGCPANCTNTLAQIACACEKQLDAMDLQQMVDFRKEYSQIRAALQQADFSWMN